MNVRRTHRPRRVNLGVNPVTAPLPAIAAAAAILMPGAGHHTGPLPAITASDTSGPDSAVLEQARLRAVVAARQQADAAMPRYTVKAGDSISAVAERKCGGQARDWTGIYAASRKAHLTGRNANMITIGQQLAIDCRYLPSQLRYAPAPPPPPPPVQMQVQTSSVTASSAAPVRHRVRSAIRRAVTGYSGNVSASSYGGYQACVIERESGGRSQVMNSSGHYGLYQFDYGTWVSGGGAGADFGHAPVAEQNRVFAAVYAARGTQPWTPSDGC